METKKINKKKRKNNSLNSLQCLCISFKNAISMEKCKKIISTKQGLCGIHNKRKLLYLPNGSLWENLNGSNKLDECVQKRLAIRFWEVIECGVTLDKLNPIYIPESLVKLRSEKIKYLKGELKRLNVPDTLNIAESRYFWFVNLLYYVGNFQNSIKKIQRFYKGVFQEKLKKRKSAVKTIWKYYMWYKFKKLLPVFIKNYKQLKKELTKLPVSHADWNY